MKIVVVIQARTGSSRLPNKVLKPLAGEPLLSRMVERVRNARGIDDVIVATTTSDADDPIRILCDRVGVRCFSGHETDLLDRHVQAARILDADVAVKIPSDCPLIDPAVIERVVDYYRDHADAFDFVSNLHPATYPDGQDVEVIPMQVLETAWREADRDFEREHTTPFIWERPDRFRIANVAWESGRDYSMSHRWTIDYPEDYAFIAAVYAELYSDARPVFSIDDILELLDRRPEIAALNARYAGVNWYRHHLNDLRTVDASMTRSV
jgi:spore coat polysaccharide biosynthesis protein SpsF